jgi:glycosyltransferase involved in cell wall biosynthesis
MGTGGARSLRVTVCACTYRRPEGLRALLAGLAAQRFRAIAPASVDVVIVDNEGSADARAACEEFGTRSPFPIRYVHEPRRGISHARNAALEALPPDGDFFAMLDDDEVPEPDWLEALLLAQQQSGADIVQGFVVPLFADGVPRWIRALDLFGWPLREPGGPPTLRENLAAVNYAATNNVLVRSAAVRASGLRFDPSLATTGGEDTVFFGTLRQQGQRIALAARARVSEAIPLERANLRYLLRVEYRKGFDPIRLKTLARRKRRGLYRLLRVRARIAARGVAWMASGALRSAAVVRGGDDGRERAADGVLRAARGFGMLASALGMRYEHY